MKSDKFLIHYCCLKKITYMFNDVINKKQLFNGSVNCRNMSLKLELAVLTFFDLSSLVWSSAAFNNYETHFMNNFKKNSQDSFDSASWAFSKHLNLWQASGQVWPVTLLQTMGTLNPKLYVTCTWSFKHTILILRLHWHKCAVTSASHTKSWFDV